MGCREGRGAGRLRAGAALGGAVLCALVSLAAALPAQGSFPYTRDGGDPRDYSDLYLEPGQVPSDLAGKEVWMYAATPEPGNFAVNKDPVELGGVRGSHIVDADPGVPTAWQDTTGRPDVVIAVLDSGIKWNDRGAMINLRETTWLNRGELPRPRNDGISPSHEPGIDCASDHQEDAWDRNGDGAFNVLDYACDSRVDPAPARGVGPTWANGRPMLDPQDLLIAFSDGVDDDGNGYVDDIVGWDFLDDDNDPYDDVQYGHGTGEALDSVARAESGVGGVGTCPSCTAMHMRVGDSFVADANRFAAAVTYATDNGALVIQEALGTLNNSSWARESVEYAYRHGVTVIASAADEAAQHNNWPSSLPHVILVNSVTKYEEFADLPDPLPGAITEQPASYLRFNGCTNFNSKITVAIPSVSCSSDATGRGAGIAGLIYAAALNAIERGGMETHPECRLVGGDPCPLTPNEVRQLMASGAIDGEGLADDVDFATKPELSCAPVPLPGCTDPTLNALPPRPSVSLVPGRRYPARAGHDQFYGYGRVNVARGTGALLPGGPSERAEDAKLPPEVEITSPEWYDQIDPAEASFALEGELYARDRSYRCAVYVAPGHYPNNGFADEIPAGDFVRVPSPHCDGSPRTESFAGKLADVPIAMLKKRFPATTGDFRGREPALGVQTSSGRPNTSPYGFVARVVAESVQAGETLTGEDRRALHLHRDRDMLPGFPLKLDSDGASSPLLVDLTGDNTEELVFGTSDGLVHALAYDPDSGATEPLAGWPVSMPRPAILGEHLAAPAYASGAVSGDRGGAVLGSVAVVDADRDGVPEVYAADLEGQIRGFSPDGEVVFEAESNPDFSGAPLEPFANVRDGKLNRTQRGFLGSPALADLTGDGKLELVIGGMDRHVYAFRHDGEPLEGFPVLVVDESKVASVDQATHRVAFRDDAGARFQQGPIITTPALADITGDGTPEIVIGTNESYAPDEGTEGPFNVAVSTAPVLSLLEPLGILNFANGRVFAIKASGEPDRPAEGESPFVEGWPAPVGIIFAELLPLVGEGVNGSPVVARAKCGLSGPRTAKVGVIPAAGPAYVLGPDGSSCFGRENGRDRTLASDVSAGVVQIDRPVIPAVGLPAWADLGGEGPSLVAPAAGVLRALDLVLSDYQGGQDFLAAWDLATGQFLPGYPSPVNDLSFLTGPAAGDVGGLPGEAVVAGTASFDLTALSAQGLPVSQRWPKLTTDWTVATPALGTLGTRPTEGGRRIVVGMTRSGYVNAYETEAHPCAPASSPRFHHDNANSGDYHRDATAPGRPFAERLEEGPGEARTLTFRAPGDDLLCGRAARYEVVTSQGTIHERNFATRRRLDPPEPRPAGEEQSLELAADVGRFVGVRAVDRQGNVGRPLVVDLGTPGQD